MIMMMTTHRYSLTVLSRHANCLPDSESEPERHRKLELSGFDVDAENQAYNYLALSATYLHDFHTLPVSMHTHIASPARRSSGDRSPVQTYVDWHIYLQVPRRGIGGIVRDCFQVGPCSICTSLWFLLTRHA